MLNIKKLRSESDRFASKGCPHMEVSPEAIGELIDHLEAAQKDAARYQWLRDKSGAESAIENYWGGDGTFVVYLNDESIDAAMASQS